LGVVAFAGWAWPRPSQMTTETVLLDDGETREVSAAGLLGATIILWRRRVGVRMLSDTADIALYWYFLVLVWVPLYAMIYLLPRA
jgi:hypothetical protein